MQFNGEFVVDGTPTEVWPYFNDPEILEDCAPGCKELVLETPSQIRASLEVGVGSVKPSFEVNGIVVECDKPNRLELQASGEASRNSFDVNAWQELTDNGDGTTTVTWQADAEVSGVIASLGERALESVTKKLVTDFFQDVEDHVVAGTPAEAKFQAAGQEEVQAAADAAAAAREGDLIDDLFEMLGSLRGGRSDEEDKAQGPAASKTAVSIGAGAGSALAVVLLWSRLRGEDEASTGAGGTEPDADAAGAAKAAGEETGSGSAETAGPDPSEAVEVVDVAAEADADTEATDSGGTLRYLLVGIVLGVVGKALWDAYSSGEDVEKTQDRVQGTAEQTGEKPAGRSDDSATARQNGSADATEASPEEGMIDDPLDRLH